LFDTCSIALAGQFSESKDVCSMASTRDWSVWFVSGPITYAASKAPATFSIVFFACCHEEAGITLSAFKGGLKAASRLSRKVVTLFPAALKSEISVLSIPKPSLNTSGGIGSLAAPPPDRYS